MKYLDFMVLDLFIKILFDKILSLFFLIIYYLPYFYFIIAISLFRRWLTLYFSLKIEQDGMVEDLKFLKLDL